MGASLEDRTRWCTALYQRASDLGAEILVLADDARQSKGPMISPHMWRQFVLPYHQRIVGAFDKPVIWHSEGDIRHLFPMAVGAGFVGVHGLDPIAGMDLAAVKAELAKTCSWLATWMYASYMGPILMLFAEKWIADLRKARPVEVTCSPAAAVLPRA